MLKQVMFSAVLAATLLAPVMPVAAVPASVVIRIGPPPMREEAVPGPRRGYDWSPGYWNWNSRRSRHDWVAGSWIRSRPGYYYSQPTWVDRDGRWEQRRGAWTRGDRDRDGIPNSRDRDRDGDGVPNRRDRAPDNPRRN
jgi:hypothetical protein